MFLYFLPPSLLQETKYAVVSLQPMQKANALIKNKFGIIYARSPPTSAQR